MRFRTIGATFGALERRSLTLGPGLNVVEAPNESGKSTLAAFLRTMLYGLPTRDRGALADKNRYQPWSGSPMQGTLELETESFGIVTLRRDTARPGSPMGRFSAVYAATGDAVPGLTAADCGETLLGVPREVYERSAFIRQSGLAVEPDAELERRIAALITAGEEDVSYTEAAAALKKQLNARRSNARNGLIPTLEREIAADAEALAELRGLQTEQRSAEDTLAGLREAEAGLRAELRLHELADRQERRAARERAKKDAEDAAREARVFRRMLEDSRVPPLETLERNRDRLRRIDDLNRQRRTAEARRADAAAARDAFRAGPRPPVLRLIGVLWLLLLIVCAAIPAAAALIPFPLPPAAKWIPAGALLFAVLFGLEVRRGVRLRRAYAQRLDALDAALREAEAACAALSAQSEETAAMLFAEIPAGDGASAATYVHANLARYETLSQMEADAAGKRAYWEAFPAAEPADAPAAPVTRPERSREALQIELTQLLQRQAETKSRADYLAGQLRSIGDAGELEATLAGKREKLTEAQRDYDALALAMEALERANTTLQNRFSPELGKRAAVYFSALTGGKYGAVALDRTFRALATETGEIVPRDAALLSQGASDQLYLAVRLAICDMILPEEKHVPLVLDDALINFDDARCAAALELLLRIAQRRQILLLTCQHREAAYLTGRENVSILTL